MAIKIARSKIQYINLKCTIWHISQLGHANPVVPHPWTWTTSIKMLNSKIETCQMSIHVTWLCVWDLSCLLGSFSTCTKLAKGQLISKCLFYVFTFFQKTNENKSTISKVEFVRSFFGRNVGLKKSFRICLTFRILSVILWKGLILLTRFCLFFKF